MVKTTIIMDDNEVSYILAVNLKCLCGMLLHVLEQFSFKILCKIASALQVKVWYICMYVPYFYCTCAYTINYLLIMY